MVLIIKQFVIRMKIFSTLQGGDILLKLQMLLAEKDSDSGGGRQGRQLSEFGYAGAGRSERQRLGNFEECTLVGFEFKNETECTEVVEVDCYNVNVTKYTVELRERCTSLVDQQCGVVTNQVHCVYSGHLKQSDEQESVHFTQIFPFFDD